MTLYAWDYETGKWTALKSATGDEAESDITLTAEVDPKRYVRNGKIQAMAQDEVKSANAPFNILWFTDTQYYAESYPDIFDKLGDWIAEEYKKGLFSYVIHTGDIVNVADDEKQWVVADRNLKKLDEAGVPYGVLAGNHDVIIDGVDYPTTVSMSGPTGTRTILGMAAKWITTAIITTLCRLEVMTLFSCISALD